jgi:hypothetical protein
MGKFWHSRARLSITLSITLAMGVAASWAALSPAQAGSAKAGPAPAGSSWYGRWTIDEENPVFSSRGRLYRTIDVAPCGKDFCGTSVGAKGVCGPVLFRFLGWRAKDAEELRGHGSWGKAKKKAQLFLYDRYEDGSDNASGKTLDLYLGNSWDFGGRSDSMPAFHGTYRRTAPGSCRSS